jgi:hypothetical protein
VDGFTSVDGVISEKGPQLILIQLLPSSTVAPAVRLKIGTGTFPSLVPGGTWYQPPAPASGGIFDPLQYCLTTPGLKTDLLAPNPVGPPGYPLMFVRIEALGWNVNPELWSVGP